MLIKKVLDVSSLVTANVLNTKIREVEKKIPDASGLAKKTGYNAKYQTLRKNILLLLIIINLQVNTWNENKIKRMSW